MHSLRNKRSMKANSVRFKGESNSGEACKSLSYLSPFSETVAGVAGALTMIPGLNIIMGSVAIGAMVVKGTGSIAEVAMGCSGMSTDEIKDILKARFNEVDRKLDQHSLVLAQVAETVRKTLTAVEETRKEMRESFQKVLDLIKNQEVRNLVSEITLIVGFVDLKMKAWKKADKNEFANIIEHELNHNELYNLIKEDGDLFKSLFFIVQHGYAIPQNVKDENAFSALFVLFYGMQTYCSIIFSLLEHHTYLAHHYYKKGDLNKFNLYFARLKFYFFKFKHILTSSDNSFVDKVILVLKTVEKTPFVRYLKHKLYDDVSNRTQSLIALKEKISTMKLEIVNEDPTNNIIVSFLNIKRDNRINTPIGEWVKGAKVSYAVQYENNGAFSLISDWTSPQTIQNLASPILEVDTSNYRRFIYRKISTCSEIGDKPQLIQILDGSQSEFRDMNRDFYNLAGDITSNCQSLTKTMDDLLGQGSSVSVQFEFQRRSIHAAAAAGNECVMNRILEIDPSQVGVEDIEGNTPLHFASKNNKIKIVKLLISKGADVNAKNKLELTALHLACRHQFLRIVNCLLESPDIKVNAADKSNLTVLHVAVSNGIYNTDILQKLLGRPEILINEKNDIGLTALHFATLQNLNQNVELLIKQSNVNEGDKNKVTPLHYAAINGYLSIVELLLGKKDEIDINILCQDKKFSPLLYAVYFKQKAVVEKLLSEPEIQIDLSSPNKYTALHLAVANGQKDIVELLLKNNAKVTDKTEEGYTPLHLSVIRKETDITNLLFSNNGETILEEKSNNGSTPLHLAAHYGNKDNFMLLCSKGADKDAKDKEENLPFHEAISGGNLEIVEYLLEHNRELIKRKNKNSKTPLYFSLKNIHVHGREMYDFLINEGADKSYQEIKGESPLYVFIKEGNVDAIKFLIYEGAVDTTKDIDRLFLYEAVEQGQLEIVRFIVENKLIDLDAMDSDGKHSLRDYSMKRAVVIQNPSLIVYLDQKDLDVSWMEPLYFASSNHNLEIIKYFVKVKKADVNRKFSQADYTPLCRSMEISKSETFNFEIVKFLVENGGNVNIDCGVGAKKVTPIQLAISRNDKSLIEYLFQNGVDPNVNDANGNSPLAYAVMYGNLDLVTYLVEDKKVDKEIRNSRNYTPVHIAAEKDFLNIFEYLVSQGAEMLAKVEGDKDTCFVASQDPSKKKVIFWIRREKEKCMSNFKRNIAEQAGIIPNSLTNLKTNQIKDRNISYEKILKNIKVLNPGNKTRESIKGKQSSLNNHMDVPGTLLLLDLLVRKMTNKKFIHDAVDNQSPLEATALALNLTDKFAEFLQTNVNIQNGLDHFDVYSKVHKAILSGKEKNLINALCSFVEKNSEIDFQNFEKFCKKI